MVSLCVYVPDELVSLASSFVFTNSLHTLDILNFVRFLFLFFSLARPIFVRLHAVAYDIAFRSILCVY